MRVTHGISLLLSIAEGHLEILQCSRDRLLLGLNNLRTSHTGTDVLFLLLNHIRGQLGHGNYESTSQPKLVCKYIFFFHFIFILLDWFDFENYLIFYCSLFFICLN